MARNNRPAGPAAPGGTRDRAGYRLYEIDRIISRTLAYAIVTGLLIGVYAGLVLVGTRVLAVTSPVAVAAATLAVAALFSPLRRRVQRLIDNRFNRARYDADLTITAVASRLAGTADLDAVRADLLGTVDDALEPARSRCGLLTGSLRARGGVPSACEWYQTGRPGPAVLRLRRAGAGG